MAINEIAVSVGILSGAMIYGQTASEMEFPKEINEGVYNTLPVSVHEVNWSDNSNKLHKLYAAGIANYNTSLINRNNSDDNNIGNNGINGNMVQDRDNNDIITDNSDIYGNYNGMDNDVKKYNKLIIPNNEYLSLIKRYERAGYKHFIVRFPVGKFKPLPSSEFEFYNLLPFDDIVTADVYGFASPDGLKPKMQEILSKNRMKIIMKNLKKENVNIDYNSYYLCDKDVPRESCWRADIFFKTKADTIDK